MCSSMVFDLMCNSLNPNHKMLVDKHLNFDVRYKLVKKIVTNKKYTFHLQQICPSIGMCRGGKCNKVLCHIPKSEFKTSAEEWENPEGEMPLLIPVIGKLVKISQQGQVTFHGPDGDATQLDMNWR